MRWSVAFSLGVRMTAVFLAVAFIGLVMAGAGLALLVTDRWSDVVEADTSGRVLAGAVLTAAGLLWTLVAAMAVLIKSIGEAVEAASGPVLSDVHARVIYIEQIVPQAAQIWRHVESPRPPQPPRRDEPPFSPFPDAPGS